MPELSVIIVNWNTAGYLRGCIQSVIDHADGIDYELIVVDNASSDGSAEMVKAEFGHLDNLILICNERNENYARGNNIGYEHSSGEYICLLNSDIVVQPGMFRALMDHLAANPQVGMVGPRMLNPDGSLQRINRRFPTWYYIFFRYSFLGRVVDKLLLGRYFNRRYLYEDKDFLLVTPIDQVGTSCAMLRREVIRNLGFLFEEQFELFFNDVDLCKRLANGNYKIQVLPNALVTHYGSQSTALLKKNIHTKLFFIGLLRYFRKHQVNGLQLLYLFLPISLIRANREDRKSNS